MISHCRSSPLPFSTIKTIGKSDQARWTAFVVFGVVFVMFCWSFRAMTTVQHGLFFFFFFFSFFFFFFFSFFSFVMFFCLSWRHCFFISSSYHFPSSLLLYFCVELDVMKQNAAAHAVTDMETRMSMNLKFFFFSFFFFCSFCSCSRSVPDLFN